jgi:carbonic anhydrase
MREKQVNIHGWVYDMNSGEIKVLQRNTVPVRE